MFDQILQVVKEHLSSDPQVAQAVPADKQEAVSKEIATQINDGLQGQQSAGGGGLLGGLAGGLGSGALGGLASGLGGLGSGSGNMLSGLLEGNAISGLVSKLGLPASATSAISAALPGLLQKIMSQFGGSAAAGLGNLGGIR